MIKCTNKLIIKLFKGLHLNDFVNMIKKENTRQILIGLNGRYYIHESKLQSKNFRNDKPPKRKKKISK